MKTSINKSELFKNAWKLFRTNSLMSFGDALKSAWNIAKSTNVPDIQKVKGALVAYAREDKWNKNTAYELGFNGDAQSVIEQVANSAFGFASEIAQTVVKYNFKISEKQAYWIAKAAVENNVSMLFDRNNELKVIFE